MDTIELTISKRLLHDLVVMCLLEERRLHAWLVDALKAGIESPPVMCIRPSGAVYETISFQAGNEIVMAAWAMAQAMAEDVGERVTAGDVFAVLVTRAARRDVVAIRAQRGDDFDFMSQQFVDQRVADSEPMPDALVKRALFVLEGVQNEFVIKRPVSRFDPVAQARANSVRDAELKRISDARMAAEREAAEDQKRLAKLLQPSKGGMILPYVEDNHLPMPGVAL